MSKIPTVEEWLYPAGVPEKELDHYLEIVKYAELVRAETLKVAAQEAYCSMEHPDEENGLEESEYIVIKSSILDLVTHPNLEIK